jgi:hypothetical protein
MLKRFWCGFIDTLEGVVRRPDPDRRLLCHVCSQDTHNRWAFYQLIYRVRGEHVCERCARKFVVTFTPNAPVTRGAASAPSPPVAGSDADVRTIIHPALPLEPGRYRVTLIHSPRWFLAWGRRQNAEARASATKEPIA